MNDSIIAAKIVREAERLVECVNQTKIRWAHNKSSARAYALMATSHLEAIKKLLEKPDGEVPSIKDMVSQFSPVEYRRLILGQWSDDNSPLREDEISFLIEPKD